MKALKKSHFIVLMAFLLMMGCKDNNVKNNNSSTQDESGVQLKNAGKPHTYEFTITGGELDGQTFSGDIENTLVVTEIILANYSAYLDFLGNGQKNISLHIFNDEIIIGGVFFFKNGNTKNFGDKYSSDFSNLSFQLDPPNVKYMSRAGTIELTETDFTDSVGINEAYTGIAAYKITFDGTFINAIDGEEVQIEGSIKVNFPANVEQY